MILTSVDSLIFLHLCTTTNNQNQQHESLFVFPSISSSIPGCFQTARRKWWTNRGKCALAKGSRINWCGASRSWMHFWQNKNCFAISTDDSDGHYGDCWCDPRAPWSLLVDWQIEFVQRKWHASSWVQLKLHFQISFRVQLVPALTNRFFFFSLQAKRELKFRRIGIIV